MTQGARYEITVDGKPRTNRDVKAIAVEAGEYLKAKESEFRIHRAGLRERRNDHHQNDLPIPGFPVKKGRLIGYALPGRRTFLAGASCFQNEFSLQCWAPDTLARHCCQVL
jgi:hypothetical protein